MGFTTRKSYADFVRENHRYDCRATWDDYLKLTSHAFYPDVDSCHTRWDSGTYLDSISRKNHRSQN